MKHVYFWIGLSVFVIVAGVFWYTTVGWMWLYKAPPPPPDAPKPTFCYDGDLMCQLGYPKLPRRHGCRDPKDLLGWVDCPKPTHSRTPPKSQNPAAHTAARD